ncbi:MAG: acyltransferase family protein, partial [Epsilonproteobacteria bacterium]|nr:acyltransferase family protein [Campylobacterota bacterium]
MDRNKDIDNLRGLAMISMMVIHACSYFLKTKEVYLLWNYLQWAVPVFLFCSFYLSLKDKRPTNYLKRLKRLFIPYWIFLFVYFLLLYFFEKKNFSFQYLRANIFLYRGIDFNWLVLLFLYFT